MVASKWFAILGGLVLALTTPPAVAANPGLKDRLAELSQNGSAEAAYHLGMLYHMGLAETPRDPRKALELFKLAAERGDPLGAYKYGCYFDGQGERIVESDPKTALRWKQVAAQRGYDLAQLDVAQHLFAANDSIGGLRWLEAAAAQGNRTALGALGALYAGMLPADVPAPAVQKDAAKGWAYFMLSARDIPKMESAFKAELAKLPPNEQRRTREIVSRWQPKPTPLSEKAVSGLSSAYALAHLPVPAH